MKYLLSLIVVVSPFSNSELAEVWIKARFFAFDSTEDKATTLIDSRESWVQDLVFNDNW
jgi:hypothetical protein